MPKVTIYEGKAKKTGNPFRAIRLEVGEWSTLVFPKSDFEMKYIEKQLRKENAEDAKFDLDDE